jgi:hypothetical protein
LKISPFSRPIFTDISETDASFRMDGDAIMPGMPCAKAHRYQTSFGHAGKATAFAAIPSGVLQQALVTEYAPGGGICWHRASPCLRTSWRFRFYQHADCASGAIAAIAGRKPHSQLSHDQYISGWIIAP